MLIIFDFNQSKNNSIYSYGIINIIWYNLLEKAKYSPNSAKKVGKIVFVNPRPCGRETQQMEGNK
jgi:hypothetical protein